MTRRGLGYQGSESYNAARSYDLADEDEPKSFSIGYARRPLIPFVKAQGLEAEQQVQQSQEQKGNDIASFYRSLTQGDAEPTPAPRYPICSVCDVAIQDPERHHLNSAHLSALANPQAPLRELSISSASSGYQYLLKYGWSPYQTTGLGAEGNEGSRAPVKVDMKLDKSGIGFKAVPEGTPAPPKPIYNATEALKQEVENKKKRKRIYNEMYGDDKVAQYFNS